jgi:hypothetical protein
MICTEGPSEGAFNYTHACGNASCRGFVRDILQHNRIGSDLGVRADVHSSQNLRPCADVYMPVNDGAPAAGNSPNGHLLKY